MLVKAVRTRLPLAELSSLAADVGLVGGAGRKKKSRSVAKKVC